ncbi:MAG: UvrD-helicase domain-containing protein [Caldilineaceae bacterium]|nr:UvrD-helicase domain-containing protein [Caldilineaceae bacterium]
MPTTSPTERIADLHIHSHYSRATSRDLTFEHLARWAQLKGVQIVATGDIAHPGWLAEMHASLEPAEEGLFRLKPEIAAAVAESVPASCQGDVRFMLMGEISNIYKRHDAVRKVHNLISAPTLEVVARIQQALERIGNIRSDGRPILGLDSRDLLEIVLEVDSRCTLIPAHIWTPWFSMLGSKSGFDSVEECFGDLTSEIFALETGLSSDPPMNWRVSNLDRYTLISNSDAHSPQKLAREATILRCEPSYDAIMAALRTGDPELFGGTLEFFPEEGKYHLDGHRKCGVCWEPPTSLAHDLRCPVCGKPVTVGTMHRIETLADRPPGQRPARTAPFFSLVTLPEVLGEVLGVGSTSRRVQQEYEKLLAKLGPELVILRHAPLEEIAAAGGSRIAEAVGRMRRGEVVAQAGYDGEYGTIRVFAPGAAGEAIPQLGLFVEEAAAPYSPAPNLFDVDPDPSDAPAPEQTPRTPAAAALAQTLPDQGARAAALPGEWLDRLNADQRAAATCVDAPLVIVAGPGTGKTRTLTVRIAHLLRARDVAPEAILAITFTNKAAEEMRSRLADLVGDEITQRLTISTFHAFGAHLLRTWGERLGLAPDFVILDDDDRAALLHRALPDLGEQELRRTLDWISHAKNHLIDLDTFKDDDDLVVRYHAYHEALAAAQAVDFDDLVRLPVQLLLTDADVRDALHARYRWLSVDEYQDVNTAQYRLLRALAADGANVCVIGDPDQAIYSFRGANPAYFHSFVQDFPGAVTVELRQSYRTPQALLEAAAQVIANNPDRPQTDAEGRRLWSAFTQEVKLEIYPASTDRAEAEYLVHTIEQAVGGTSYFSLDSGRVAGTAAGDRSFGDFAILYRLGVQRRALIEAFDRSGIPYQIVGDALTSHRHIRELLALLRLRAQPAHALLPLTTLLGNGKGAPTEDVLAWLAEQVAVHGVETALRGAAISGSLKPAQRRRIGGLLALGTDWPAPADGTTRLDEIIPPLFAAWASWQGEKPTPAQNERVAQLRLRAIPFGTQTSEFLDQMALQRGADAFDPRADRVAIMSLHAAKGLEFPVVFMVGCEEGLLPYLPPNEEQTVDIAEERRLFYVGMTRAQETLTLTYAARRLLFGQMVTLPPSRFVGEIEAARKAILTPSQLPQKREKAEDLQLKLF